MQSNIDIARRLVIYQLISGMKITLDEAEQLIYELEDSGLIQFDQEGRVRILDLEEDHEEYFS